MYILTKLCRLCRGHDNINSTLNHIDSDNLSLFQKFDRIAPGIILERNPDLPDGVCMTCITELNLAYKFITKCFESQAIFQQYLEQSVNNQEILIKAVKLDESHCNSEMNSPNSITVKAEKETGFLNDDQVNFTDNITVEDNILANVKKENIAESYNDSDEMEHVYDEDASLLRGDHSDSININNKCEFTEVNNMKTDEDEFENKAKNLTSFVFVECGVANDYKVKQEHFDKIINKEHMINVDKVLEGSEIGEDSSNIQAPYKCKICDKVCKRKLDLTRHTRTHADKSYHCPVCGKASVFKSDLVKHMRIHTNEKPYKCEICDRAFNHPSNLRQHIRIHANEKSFKCETCNSAFNDPSSLKKHNRIHSNEKPFKCETCDKAFNQSIHLKQHIRVHTNEKPFNCETCSKAFNQSSSLKQHIRIHTNEKPFTCETCNRAFNQSSHLKQHIRIHVNEKKTVKC